MTRFVEADIQTSVALGILNIEISDIGYTSGSNN
jgi:hypothetical protein